LKNNISAGMFLLFFITTITTMVACTTTTAPEPEPDLRQHWQHGALAYYRWVVAATPAALRQEQDRIENSVSISSGSEQLVQLALVVGATTLQSTDRVSDHQQSALDLLDQFEHHADNTVAGSDYHALAHLWRQVLESRLKISLLRGQIEALTTIERKIDIREQQED
jgi:hypothetical protein